MPAPAGEEAAATAPPAASSNEVRPLAGFRAPTVLARDVVTQEPVVLSSLKGQLVLLNFWATWCGPCRVEMPALEQFHKEMGGKVRVVALGADSVEGPDKLIKFAQELGLSFTIAYDAGEAVEKYRVVGIPTTFFIDQDGVIRFKHQGPATLEQMRKWAAEAGQAAK